DLGVTRLSICPNPHEIGFLNFRRYLTSQSRRQCPELVRDCRAALRAPRTDGLVAAITGRFTWRTPPTRGSSRWPRRSRYLAASESGCDPRLYGVYSLPGVGVHRQALNRCERPDDPLGHGRPMPRLRRMAALGPDIGDYLQGGRTPLGAGSRVRVSRGPRINSAKQRRQCVLRSCREPGVTQLVWCRRKSWRRP